MKFQKIHNKKSIFTPGTLTDLSEKVFSGLGIKEYNRMTESELERLHTIYSAADPRVCKITELENDKVYKTINNEELLGSDIKAATMMMWLKPRSAYVDMKSKQIHKSSISGAVPIPLLGFKRHFKIEYSKWWDSVASYFSFDSKEYTVDIKDLEVIWYVDLLLGHTFASTTFSPITDQVELQNKWGLLLLAATDEPEITKEHLDHMRTNIGNRRGSFANTYGASEIAVTIENKKDYNLYKLHNNSSSTIRMMLSQSWVWYGNHRSTDMICDPWNWDTQPHCYDTLSQGFVGLKPTSSDNLKKWMNL